MKRKIAFALIMGMITTCIISFVLISINLGFGEKFISTWLKSWLLAYLFAVSSILIIAPRVEKILDKIFINN